MHRGAIAPYEIITAWIGHPGSGASLSPSHGMRAMAGCGRRCTLALGRERLSGPRPAGAGVAGQGVLLWHKAGVPLYPRGGGARTTLARGRNPAGGRGMRASLAHGGPAEKGGEQENVAIQLSEKNA